MKVFRNGAYVDVVEHNAKIFKDRNLIPPKDPVRFKTPEEYERNSCGSAKSI